MRPLFVLGATIAVVLATAAGASALTSGTVRFCTFSSAYGTPSWSDATGAPIGTKTVCSRSTLSFDHTESDCVAGTLFSVPVFFGVSVVDFYLGNATTGGVASDGFYHAVRPNATPAYSLTLFGGFVDDWDSATPVGSCTA
jgi:hypothetical protein